MAVYLPLDGGRSTAPADVSLVLHGEFFVDAGRQALVPEPTDGQPNIEAEWNRDILEQAVLPSVPAAVLRFAETTSADVSRGRLIEGLVHEIRRVADPVAGKGMLFGQRRSAVCRDEQLIPRLKAGMAWVLAPSAESVHKVVWGDAKNQSDPFTVLANALPGLDSVAETHLLVPAGMATLTREEPRDLPPDMAARLLGQPGGLVAAAGHDEIVVPLLRAMATDPAFQHAVVDHARALIVAWAASDRRDTDLKRLAKASALVAPTERVLEVDDDLPPDLLGLSGPVLLLPRSLTTSGNDRPRGRVPEAAAIELLRAAIGLGMSPD